MREFSPTGGKTWQVLATSVFACLVVGGSAWAGPFTETFDGTQIDSGFWEQTLGSTGSTLTQNEDLTSVTTAGNNELTSISTQALVGSTVTAEFTVVGAPSTFNAFAALLLTSDTGGSANHFLADSVYFGVRFEVDPNGVSSIRQNLRNGPSGTTTTVLESGDQGLPTTNFYKLELEWVSTSLVNLRLRDHNDTLLAQGGSTLSGMTVPDSLFVSLASGGNDFSVTWDNVALSNATSGAVPEPATWAVVAGGLAALAVRRRRDGALRA